MIMLLLHNLWYRFIEHITRKYPSELERTWLRQSTIKRIGGTS